MYCAPDHTTKVIGLKSGGGLTHEARDAPKPEFAQSTNLSRLWKIPSIPLCFDIDSWTAVFRPSIPRQELGIIDVWLVALISLLLLKWVVVCF